MKGYVVETKYRHDFDWQPVEKLYERRSQAEAFAQSIRDVGGARVVKVRVVEDDGRGWSA